MSCPDCDPYSYPGCRACAKLAAVTGQPTDPRTDEICIHGNDPMTCDERPDGRCHVPKRDLTPDGKPWASFSELQTRAIDQLRARIAAAMALCALQIDNDCADFARAVERALSVPSVREHQERTN